MRNVSEFDECTNIKGCLEGHMQTFHTLRIDNHSNPVHTQINTQQHNTA